MNTIVDILRTHATALACVIATGAIALLVVRARLARGVAQRAPTPSLVLTDARSLAAHAFASYTNPTNVWLALLSRGFLDDTSALLPIAIEPSLRHAQVREACGAVTRAMREQAKTPPRTIRAALFLVVALGFQQIALQVGMGLTLLALAGELPLVFIALAALVFITESTSTLVVERALSGSLPTATVVARIVLMPVVTFALPLLMVAALLTSDRVRHLVRALVFLLAPETTSIARSRR